MFKMNVVRKRHKKLPTSIAGPSKVKCGFPSGEADADVIMRAYFNEFGTNGSGKGFKTARGGGFGGPIPERPFMRNAMKSNQGRYRQLMKAAAIQILTGQSSMAAVLARLGAAAKSDIQGEINSMSSPKNSPVTIALKGSEKPLVDSGEMRGGVTWKIDQ